ncbi:MAG TPA: AraC family transcriptional regulator [Sphingopyxis sp.]|nr:AraC family transcriptional regulator [Sphingopyxis sp.]
MADPVAPFLTSCFPVGTRALAPHANLVTAVLAGRTGPLRLERNGLCVEGDLLLVRPGVIHGVALAERGADVLYLNGLAFPFDAPLAQPLEGVLARVARDALGGDVSAVAELRDRLAPPCERMLPPDMATVVRAIHGDPMWRMPQDELASRLGMERTQALRYFRRATGQGFREFKLWSALQYATQQMAGGALVRTAAMDAGFADTAHLSRVFRRVFGLTPSEGIAGLSVAPVIARDRALRTAMLM